MFHHIFGTGVASPFVSSSYVCLLHILLMVKVSLGFSVLGCSRIAEQRLKMPENPSSSGIVSSRGMDVS